MQRIPPIDQAAAPEKTAELLAAAKARMGVVPNILATLAQSPAALSGYLSFAGALGEGKLSAALREQIALAVAGKNQCDYCASAHSAVGRACGLAADEIVRNLAGEASDAKARAALRFVTRIVAARGDVADEDLGAVHAVGFSEEEIVEIVAHTMLNMFTNYFNHVARTEIDFPVVKTSALAA